MKLQRRNPYRAAALFAAALALAAGACDNPVDTDDHDHEHAEPEVVQVRQDGVVVASAEGDDGDDDHHHSTGSIEVAVGQATGHFEVVFVDHDGDVIEIDDDLAFGFEIADEAIARLEQESPGEFGGQVRGLQAGSTTIRFMLMHGDHPDFTAEPIVIEVVEASE